MWFFWYLHVFVGRTVRRHRGGAPFAVAIVLSCSCCLASSE